MKEAPLLTGLLFVSDGNLERGRENRAMNRSPRRGLNHSPALGGRGFVCQGGVVEEDLADDFFVVAVHDDFVDEAVEGVADGVGVLLEAFLNSCGGGLDLFICQFGDLGVEFGFQVGDFFLDFFELGFEGGEGGEEAFAVAVVGDGVIEVGDFVGGGLVFGGFGF